MRTFILLVALLIARVAPALAEEAFVPDSRAQLLPDGKVYAVEGDRIIIVDTQPTPEAELYMLEVELRTTTVPVYTYDLTFTLSPGQRATDGVFSSMRHEGEIEFFHMDAILQVSDISQGEPVEVGRLRGFETDKLAQGKRFVIGNLELVIYAPTFQTFTARVTRTTTPPPVLGPALPGEPATLRHVLSRPAPVREDLGWLSGSL